MRIYIDERRIQQIASEHLAPHVAEWWIVQQYGNDHVPAGLSDFSLAIRLKVNRRTLSYHLHAARQTMTEALRAEAKRLAELPALVYVGQENEEVVSFDITIAEGCHVRTVTDKTAKRAIIFRKR